METPTGSNVSHRVCRYDEDADAALHRQMTQDAINQAALTGAPMRP